MNANKNTGSKVPSRDKTAYVRKVIPQYSEQDIKDQLREIVPKDTKPSADFDVHDAQFAAIRQSMDVKAVGTTFDPLREVVHNDPNVIRKDPKDIYSEFILDSKCLPRSDPDVVFNALEPLYVKDLDECVYKIYKNAPKFYVTVVTDRIQFRLFQKYFMLLEYIQYISDTMGNPEVSTVNGIDEIRKWVQVRRDSNIGYVLRGPEGTADGYNVDYKTKYRALIAGSSSIDDIAQSQMLSVQQTISADLNKFREEWRDRNDSYLKLADDARKYVLSIDSTRDVRMYVEDKVLYFDFKLVDLGEVRDEVVSTNYFTSEYVQRREITSMVNTMKLQEVMQFYTRIRISTLILDPSLYITPLDGLRQVYVVFRGVRANERFVSNVYNGSDLKIGGHFIRTDRGYEFVQDTDVITYKPQMVKVTNFEMFLTTGGTNSIICNEQAITFRKEDVYNHTIALYTNWEPEPLKFRVSTPALEYNWSHVPEDGTGNGSFYNMRYLTTTDVDNLFMGMTRNDWNLMYDIFYDGWLKMDFSDMIVQNVMGSITKVFEAVKALIAELKRLELLRPKGFVSDADVSRLSQDELQEIRTANAAKWLELQRIYDQWDMRFWKDMVMKFTRVIDFPWDVLVVSRDLVKRSKSIELLSADELFTTNDVYRAAVEDFAKNISYGDSHLQPISVSMYAIVDCMNEEVSKIVSDYVDTLNGVITQRSLPIEPDTIRLAFDRWVNVYGAIALATELETTKVNTVETRNVEVKTVDVDNGTIDGKYFSLDVNGNVVYQTEINNRFRRYRGKESDLCLYNLMTMLHDGVIEYNVNGTFFYSEAQRMIQNIPQTVRLEDVSNNGFFDIFEFNNVYWIEIADALEDSRREPETQDYRGWMYPSQYLLSHPSVNPRQYMSWDNISAITKKFAGLTTYIDWNGRNITRMWLYLSFLNTVREVDVSQEPWKTLALNMTPEIAQTHNGESLTFKSITLGASNVKTFVCYYDEVDVLSYGMRGFFITFSDLGNPTMNETQTYYEDSIPCGSINISLLTGGSINAAYRNNAYAITLNDIEGLQLGNKPISHVETIELSSGNLSSISRYTIDYNPTAETVILSGSAVPAETMGLTYNVLQRGTVGISTIRRGVKSADVGNGFAYEEPDPFIQSMLTDNEAIIDTIEYNGDIYLPLTDNAMPMEFTDIVFTPDPMTGELIPTSPEICRTYFVFPREDPRLNIPSNTDFSDTVDAFGFRKVTGNMGGMEWEYQTNEVQYEGHTLRYVNGLTLADVGNEYRVWYNMTRVRIYGNSGLEDTISVDKMPYTITANNDGITISEGEGGSPGSSGQYIMRYVNDKIVVQVFGRPDQLLPKMYPDGTIESGAANPPSSAEYITFLFVDNAQVVVAGTYGGWNSEFEYLHFYEGVLNPPTIRLADQDIEWDSIRFNIRGSKLYSSERVYSGSGHADEYEMVLYDTGGLPLYVNIPMDCPFVIYSNSNDSYMWSDISAIRYTCQSAPTMLRVRNQNMDNYNPVMHSWKNGQPSTDISTFGSKLVHGPVISKSEYLEYYSVAPSAVFRSNRKVEIKPFYNDITMKGPRVYRDREFSYVRSGYIPIHAYPIGYRDKVNGSFVNVTSDASENNLLYTSRAAKLDIYTGDMNRNIDNYPFYDQALIYQMLDVFDDNDTVDIAIASETAAFVMADPNDVAVYGSDLTTLGPKGRSAVLPIKTGRITLSKNNMLSALITCDIPDTVSTIMHSIGTSTRYVEGACNSYYDNVWCYNAEYVYFLSSNIQHVVFSFNNVDYGKITFVTENYVTVDTKQPVQLQPTDGNLRAPTNPENVICVFGTYVPAETSKLYLKYGDVNTYIMWYSDGAPVPLYTGDNGKYSYDAHMTRGTQHAKTLNVEKSLLYHAFHIPYHNILTTYWSRSTYVQSLCFMHLPVKSMRLPLFTDNTSTNSTNISLETMSNEYEKRFVYRVCDNGDVEIVRQLCSIRPTGIYIDDEPATFNELYISYINKFAYSITAITTRDITEASEAVIITLRNPLRSNDIAFVTMYFDGNGVLTSVDILESQYINGRTSTGETHSLKDTVIPSKDIVYLGKYAFSCEYSFYYKFNDPNVYGTVIIYDVSVKYDDETTLCFNYSNGTMYVEYVATPRYSNLNYEHPLTLSDELFSLNVDSEHYFRSYDTIKYAQRSVVYPQACNRERSYQWLIAHENTNVSVDTAYLQGSNGEQLIESVEPHETMILESINDKNISLSGVDESRYTIDQMAIGKQTGSIVPNGQRVLSVFEFN